MGTKQAQGANLPPNPAESTGQVTQETPPDGFKPVPAAIDKRKWPKFPPKFNSWEEFEEAFAEFTVDQWSHFTSYLYRAHPYILRAKGEQHIDKFCGTSQGKDVRLTRSEIVKTHGGGRYKLTIIDDDNEGRIATVVWIQVLFSEAMPILNLKELDMADRNNRQYIDRLKIDGIIDERNNIVEETRQAAATNAGEVLREATTLVTTLLDRRSRGEETGGSMKMVVDTLNRQMDWMMKQGQGSKDEVTKLGDLVKVVQAMMGGSKSDDGFMVSMVKSLQDQNTMLMKTLFEKVNAPPPAAPDPFSQMDVMLSVMGKLRDFGGGEEPTGKKGTLETFIETIPAIVAPFAPIMGQYLGGGATFVTPPNGDQPMGAVQTTQQPQEQQNVTALQKAQLVQVINTKGQEIINHIWQADSDGGQFASAIAAQGDVAKNLLEGVQNLGAPAILETFKSVPKFWEILAPREGKVEVWVHQFCNWGKVEEGVAEEVKGA